MVKQNHAKIVECKTKSHGKNSGHGKKKKKENKSIKNLIFFLFFHHNLFVNLYPIVSCLLLEIYFYHV